MAPSASCSASGLRLTTADERAEIAAIADRHVAGLSDADLRRAGLRPVRRGAGPRGRRPPRRAAARVQGVRRGGVRPRPGQGRLRHRDAGPGHQHAGPVGGAGEAGQVQRRDPRRHHAGGVHPADRSGRAPWHRRRGPRGRAAGSRGWTRGRWPGLASRRTYPLRSSFAPTYNMAVNLVGSVGRERARTLLEQSFAQFQSDRSVVGVARSLARNTRGDRRALGQGAAATAATSRRTPGCGPRSPRWRPRRPGSGSVGPPGRGRRRLC